MKIMKKWLIGVLVLSMAALGMTGCGKEVTAESILAECKENVTDYTTMEGTLILEMEMSAKAEGISMDMSMSMDMDIQTQRTETQEISYMNGSMALGILGETLEEEMEFYTVAEGNNLKTYTYSYETWTYAEETVDDMSGMIESFDAIYSEAANWVLSEETVTKESLECYELTGVIKGEDVEALLDMSEQITSDLNVDLTQIEMPVTLYVSVDDLHPAAVLLDMGASMSSLYEEGEEGSMEFTVFTVAFENLVYNSDIEIVIPEEALAAENVEFTEEEFFEEEYYEEADEALLAEITAAGEYTLVYEDTTDQIHLSWPAGYECTFISDYGMMTLMNNYYDLEYDLYPKAYYTAEDVQMQIDDWIQWCQDDPEFYADLQVSDPQIMTTADGRTYMYVTLNCNFSGDTPNTDYLGWIEFDDSFLIVNGSFMTEEDTTAEMQEIIGGISLANGTDTL